MSADAVDESGASSTAHERSRAHGASRLVGSRLRFHPAIIVIVGACAALFHQIMHVGLAGDVYFHWAAGVWMLDHHSVIRTDVFSYTVAGRHWLADEWGYEVALAWLVRTFGAGSFWLVSAGSCSAAVLLGAATWRRAGAAWLWIAALSALAAGGLVVGLAVRPQDPSYMFFAAELFLLSLARGRTRWLIALPPLLLVWANVHGSFLLGLGVLGLEVLWSVLPDFPGRLRVSRRLPTRPVAATAAFSIGATFINPHGVALLGYALHVSSSTELTSLIQEWQSPNFHGLLVLFLVVGPLLWLIGTLGCSDRPLALEDVVISFVLLIATLHAVRFLPYLVLAWCAVLSRATPLRTESIRPSLLSLPIAIVLAVALVAGPHIAAGAPAQGQSGNDMPVAAAEFVQQQHGRVFSTYWWGDYLIHLGVPVFVDGRTDLYFGTDILSTYVNVSSLYVEPDAIFRHWDVQWVLWNRSSALSTYLLKDHHWKLVLSSGDAEVFQHLGPWYPRTHFRPHASAKPRVEHNKVP